MIHNVTMAVCDDIRFEIGGKFILVGVYTGDISIVPGPLPVGQLIFLFQAEGLREATPKVLEFEVTLPGDGPRRTLVQPPKFETVPERTRWFARGVVMVRNQVLHAGKISAKAIADGKEFEVSGPWISHLQTPLGNA